MNDRDTSAYIADILQVISRVESILAGHDYESFSDDFAVRMATERGLEIISEASRHLPPACKAREADIPWRKITAIGNVLRHAYHKVEIEVLWKICKEDLGPLQEAMLRMQRQTRQP